jgi:hypothetical protein
VFGRDLHGKINSIFLSREN